MGEYNISYVDYQKSGGSMSFPEWLKKWKDYKVWIRYELFLFDILATCQNQDVRRKAAIKLALLGYDLQRLEISLLC